jgi:hypothetical protein
MKNRIVEYLPTSWFKRPPGSKPGDTEGERSLKAWAQPVEEFVANHPGTSLAIAFAAGVAIAWWLKRR